jgi:hypothetical protein
VKVERLDNLVPKDEWVLFMKVDAQGHDFKALQRPPLYLSVLVSQTRHAQQGCREGLAPP